MKNRTKRHNEELLYEWIKKYNQINEEQSLLKQKIKENEQRMEEAKGWIENMQRILRNHNRLGLGGIS